jgi:hypothetical protein
MSPDDFWKYFADEYKRWWYANEEENKVSYEKDGLWSEKILPFLERLGKKKYCVQKECWPKIDIGYFSDCRVEWSPCVLEVAIEHENKLWPDWKTECSKLVGINAGLKVIITSLVSKISR